MKYIFAIAGTVTIFGFAFFPYPGFERKDKLSEYGFFTGDLKELVPAREVLPYDVRNPLFSNYAYKARFIKLPPGTAAVYDDSSVFNLPEQTVLIKNFFFYDDERNFKGKHILETRLLVNTSAGWEAFPYIWNDEQTEAYYDPAGETKSISYTNRRGKRKTAPYVIPNKNQCKGCHTNNGVMMPIGITARQLSTPFDAGNRTELSPNQLETWTRLGLLQNAPPNFRKAAAWDEPGSGTVGERARSYLDSNCGHCHSRTGPASTSGLFLDIFETDPVHLGVNKPPVAAGRGAGSLEFDIVPGEPNQSILLFRMKTNDPAIAMPEIGREQVHAEGVALIEEWIRKSDFAVK
jgi:uncharacterized repeat protein (TIGR03806 family)